MNCEVCEGPLHPASKYGVCSKSEPCRTEGAVRRQRQWRTDNPERTKERGRQSRARCQPQRTEYQNNLRATPPGRARVLYDAAKHRAKKAGLEFDLTPAWVEQELMRAIDAGCPYLGIPIVFDGNRIVDGSATIDRFDSSKGYTQDNCLIVSHKGNRIKNNATVVELVTLTGNVKKLSETRFPDVHV